jgi:hypothetical protein
MPKTFSKKNRQSIFFSLRFRVFLSDGSLKTLRKRFTKQIVPKCFYKTIDQKSKTDFFSICFYHVFRGFSVKGVQKHHKKILKNKSDPGPFFWPLTHPPTTGVGSFFWGGPWVGHKPLGGSCSTLGFYIWCRKSVGDI